MQIQMGGWKKVYFYYGIVFFGLGLFGFLINNRLEFTKITRVTFDDFFTELADIGLTGNRESREVTALNPGTAPIGFVCLDNDGKSRYGIINEQLQRRMEGRIRFRRIEVSDKEWFNTGQVDWSLNNHRFLIGLDLSENREDLERTGIVFTVPKAMAAEFVNRVLNRLSEIPSFKLELISREPFFLYRFNIGESILSSGHLMKVIDILLDLWESSLRRGNFGETLW